MAYSAKILVKDTSNIPAFAAARLVVGWADTADNVPEGDISRGHTTIPRRPDFVLDTGSGVVATFKPTHAPAEHLHFPRLVVTARANIDPINRIDVGKRIAPGLGSVLTELGKLWPFALSADAGLPNSQFRQRLPRLVLETGLNAPETLVIDDLPEFIGGVPRVSHADAVGDWLGLVGLVRFWLDVLSELSDALNDTLDGRLDWLRVRKNITEKWEKVQPTNWYTFSTYSRSFELLFQDSYERLAAQSARDGYANPADDPEVKYGHQFFGGMVGTEFYRLQSWYGQLLHRGALVTREALRKRAAIFFLEEFYKRAGGSLRFAYYPPKNGMVSPATTVQCGVGVWVLAELGHLFGGLVKTCLNGKCNLSHQERGAYCSPRCKRASNQRAFEKTHPGRRKKKNLVTNL
jgi:hypothetical protein